MTKKSLLLMIVLLFLASISESNAGWWNTSWDYSRSITITNNNNTFAMPFNYSINFTLDTQSLINNNKMKSDCSDIRIILDNTTLLINRYVESCNTTSTIIGFRTTSNITSVNSSYKVYYGNSNAIIVDNNVSNWHLVWIDFSDNACTGWTVNAGEVDCTNGYMATISGDNNNGWYNIINQNFEMHYSASSRFRVPTGSAFTGATNARPLEMGNASLDIYGATKSVDLNRNGDCSSSRIMELGGNGIILSNTCTADNDVWHDWKLNIFQKKAELWEDGVSQGRNESTNIVNTKPTRLWYYTERIPVHWDNFSIDYYVEPVPTINVGTESMLLTITFIYPNGTYNETYNNYNGWINITSSKNVSCSVNDTRWQLNISDNTTNTYLFYNLNYTNLVDGSYSVEANCTDGLENSGQKIVWWTIDTGTPTITVSSTLSSNLAIVYPGLNLTASINISDAVNQLYGLNITIDGTQVVFNITNISDTTYNYSLNFDPRIYNLTTGVHTLSVEASDAHTAKEIPTYHYTKDPLSKSIKYNFKDGWIKIKPLKKGLFSDFNTWREKDRYVFQFEKDLAGKILYGDDMEFKVSSSDKLDIIHNTKYPAHIVSNAFKQWIDFDSTYKDAEVYIQRIDDKTIIVSILGVEDDVVLFSSIGPLNVNVNNYTFYYMNFTETYMSKVLEIGSARFSLNFTINDTFVGDIDAVLNYNGTDYTPSKTPASSYIYFDKTILTPFINENLTNISFYWDWNVTNNGSGNNLTNSTDTINHTLYRMEVTNCTGSLTSTYALNFTVYEQVTNALVDVPPDAQFVIWNRTSTLTKTYGLEWNNDSAFEVCIYPSWASLNSNYHLLYAAQGDTNERIVFSDALTNVTQNINLYIFGTGEDISITLVDEYDEGIENANVEAWIYSLINNNYTLVAEDTTDINGLVVMNLYRAGEDEYKFLVYGGTTLLYESSRFKLDATSYTFRVITEAAVESILISLQNLDYTLSINKTTRNFSLTWNDLTGLISNIIIDIIKVNTTNDISISYQSSTSSSGTLFYNVSDTSGVYIANIYVNSTADNLIYWLDSVSLDIREEWDLFGVNALLISLFFIGTMMFIGITISGEVAIVLTFVGMFIFYALGFIQVSLSGLISLFISGIIIVSRIKKE